ncbi:MAG: hypothetical protein NC121_13500 [Blautia sp.]|nr:hypothetical protein [Blautia sp.]
MNINFGDNTVVSGSQFGDGNIIINEAAPIVPVNMPEEHWKELNTALVFISQKKDISDQYRTTASEALSCVQNKNTKGLISFMKEHADGFVKDILSGLLSTGLQSLLQSLCR